MKLSTWCEAEYGRASWLADKMNIERAFVSKMCHEGAAIPIIRALEIERLTKGEVMRWDCRPQDWHVIWPECVGKEGAPGVKL